MVDQSRQHDGVLLVLVSRGKLWHRTIAQLSMDVFRAQFRFQRAGIPRKPIVPDANVSIQVCLHRSDTFPHRSPRPTMPRRPVRTSWVNFERNKCRSKVSRIEARRHPDCTSHRQKLAHLWT